MTPDEYEFWKNVYIASVQAGLTSSEAEGRATRAVTNYRKLK